MRSTVSFVCTLGFVILLAAPAAAQQTCVEMAVCDNGQPFLYCNIVSGSSVVLWYQIGSAEFHCEGMDCQAAAQASTAYCYSNGGPGGGGQLCLTPCGGGCCDDSGGQCCNGGCLAEGQTCCGEGACEAGEVCANNQCIPEGAADCGDGSYCVAGMPCCNGGCLYAWETCCGSGKCGQGEVCQDGLCLPANGVVCPGGAVCPEGTACAGDQCCPNGFASYDPASGFCCGAGPEAGLCACAVGCEGFCCPEGTVCCPGGFCAASSDQCPGCPPMWGTYCPNHQCAPDGATCCANGQFCNNALTCMDCGNGNTCCGHQSNPAQSTQWPNNPGNAQAATILAPVASPSTGTSPGAPSIDANPAQPPAAVKPAKGPGGDSGCSTGPGRPSPVTPWLLLALLALALRLRRA